MTGEFPAQMGSNAENVSIWWRHHLSVEGLVHDAVLIWAYGVNRTLEQGGAPDDGVNISKNIFNTRFNGVSAGGQVRLREPY